MLVTSCFSLRGLCGPNSDPHACKHFAGPQLSPQIPALYFSFSECNPANCRPLSITFPPTPLPGDEAFSFLILLPLCQILLLRKTASLLFPLNFAPFIFLQGQVACSFLGIDPSGACDLLEKRARSSRGEVTMYFPLQRASVLAVFPGESLVTL